MASILEELGYDMGPEALEAGFFSYGVDSVEVGVIRSRLCGLLGMDLPKTLLFDFPSAAELGAHLDKLRQAEPKAEPKEPKAAAKPEQPARKLAWESLTSGDVLELQAAMLKCLGSPVFQAELAGLAKKCFPNKRMYLYAAAPCLLQLHGDVLVERGLINDTDRGTVKAGAAKLGNAVREHWNLAAIRQNFTNFTRLTSQEALWAPQSRLCRG